jgi:enolase
VFKVDSANAAWYQRKGVVTLCRVIEETLARALKGMSIHDCTALDTVLWTTDPSETKPEIGGNTITAVSLALHAASAALRHTSLAQSLAQAHQIETRQTRPVIAVFSPRTTGTVIRSSSISLHGLISVCCVAISGGKLKIRGIHLVPAEGLTPAHAIHAIATVTSFLKVSLVLVTSLLSLICLDQEIVSKKLGAAAINTTLEGSLTAPIDKLEQALDFIIEATAQAALTGQVKIYLDYGVTGPVLLLEWI